MATAPIRKALRSPPPASIATLDPVFNQWLHNLARVMSGVVAPVANLGEDGDWYCNTAAKHIYVKVNKVWVLIV